MICAGGLSQGLSWCQSSPCSNWIHTTSGTVLGLLSAENTEGYSRGASNQTLPAKHEPRSAASGHFTFRTGALYGEHWRFGTATSDSSLELGFYHGRYESAKNNWSLLKSSSASASPTAADATCKVGRSIHLGLKCIPPLYEAWLLQ